MKFHGSLHNTAECCSSSSSSIEDHQILDASAKPRKQKVDSVAPGNKDTTPEIGSGIEGQPSVANKQLGRVLVQANCLLEKGTEILRAFPSRRVQHVCKCVGLLLHPHVCLPARAVCEAQRERGRCSTRRQSAKEPEAAQRLMMLDK
jgi:hypothetical protein